MSFLWDKLMRPVLFGLDAERAHELGIAALTRGLASRFYVDDPSFGMPPIERFGISFANPLGIAAGFDKNGVVVEQLAKLGFGYVEVGTVTYRPQPGNPKPRLFRLPQDKALINRMGFNNDGAVVVAERLSRVTRRCVVGANIGRNKEVANDEAIENYVRSFEILQPVADYIAVNVSSPNTPGLRDLQHQDHLGELLKALVSRNIAIGAKPLLVKIAPDLTRPEIEAVVKTCIEQNISGIIATNTTISRAALTTPDVERFGTGGISGIPLRSRSDEVISEIYRLASGRLPIIGVGGIFSADDAIKKFTAGASLIQAYTGFVYTGPAYPRSINAGLAKALRQRNYSVDDLVGTGSFA